MIKRILLSLGLILGGISPVLAGSTLPPGVSSVAGLTGALSAAQLIGQLTAQPADALTTLGRPNSARGSDVINVKDSPFFAKGDGTSPGKCSIVASSAVLTCVVSATWSGFKSTDVGKSYYLQGSGASGVPQIGTISGYTNVTTVTLSQSAVLPAYRYGIYNSPSAQIGTPTAGAGYVPGDTITLTGGTFTTAATLTLTGTQVSSASLNTAGTGGTTGACTVTGTTGTGTKFTALGTVTSGGFGGAISISSAGDYTVNPTNIAAEPVTGCGLSGAKLTITMGVSDFSSTVITPGSYSVQPTNPVAQGSTSGVGSGATFTVAPIIIAGTFSYFTDDTAAITAAAAAATAVSGTLYFPSGAYALVTQTASIPLVNMAIKGSGRVGYNSPYTSGGSSILVFNKTTPAFSGIKGVDIDGLGIFYPEQDNSQATPVIFPALFSCTQNCVNVSFRNMRISNAYALLLIPTGSGLGRVIFSNDTAYCVSRCFDFENGTADLFSIDSTNYFGPGGYDNGAPYGSAMLGRYTAANGEFIHVDTLASGVPIVSGLSLSGFIVQGMRYGIRLVSGTLTLSNMTNLNMDSVQTVLSIEGSSAWISSAYIGGEIYSTSIYDATANGNVFNNTSTGQSEMVIAGVHVTTALGDVVYDGTGGFLSLVFNDNQVRAYGQSTTTGPYYGMFQGGGNAGSSTVSGNVFSCKRNGQQENGIGTAVTGGSLLITGNAFLACSNDLLLSGAGGNKGTITVTGNASFSTVANSMSDTTTGNIVVKSGLNSWDGPIVARNPSVTSCGTLPVITSSSDNGDGSVTVGTGTVTSCNVVFTVAAPIIPKSIQITPESIAMGPLAVTAKSTTGFTVSTSASTMGGFVFDYKVSQ